MYKSLILNYIERNANKLQPLDHILLGVAGLAILFSLFMLFRALYRTLVRRRRGVQRILSSGSPSTEHWDLVRRFKAERALLEQQVAALGESFSAFRSLYSEKKAAGAKLEDLSERVLNYALSMRRSMMQMAAAANALLLYERMRSLLRIYAQNGVESRLPDAKPVQDIADELESLRRRVIEPILSGKALAVPDPQKFLEQFSVPGAEDARIEVFDKQMDDLFDQLRSSIEKAVK